MSTPDHNVVDGRSCADCTLCCKLLGVDSLAKPRAVWCEHCDIGKGCRIYATRPTECAQFYCRYMTSADLGGHWKPAICHMVLGFESAANRVSIYVDDGFADAWRQEPYLSEIRQWGLTAAHNGGQVIVWHGLNAIAILPDREKDLGIVRDGQVLVVGRKKGPDGPIFDAKVMEPGDPRLQTAKT